MNKLWKASVGEVDFLCMLANKFPGSSFY